MIFSRNHKVYTEFREPTKPLTPSMPRKYTMTHSDETGDLFVVVSTNYAEDKINKTRDEVRLEWAQIGARPILYGEVLIDGKNVPGNAKVRDTIFKKEMPLALQAIRYGDRAFFEANASRDLVPIMIQFISSNPTYNKLYSFGTMNDYKKLDRPTKK